MNTFHEDFMSKSSWYADWHANGLSRIAHWAFFLFFLILAATTLIREIEYTALHEMSSSNVASVSASQAQTGREARSQSQIPALNTQLFELMYKIGNIQAEERSAVISQLRTLADERKKLVLGLMESDPREVLNTAVNVEVRAGMPEDVRELVEEKRTVRGKFEFLHTHFGEFDSGGTEDTFFITDEDTKKRYKVHFPDEQIEAGTGDTVTVSGYVLENQMVAENGDLVVAEAETLPPNVRKVAAILVSFPSKPLTLSPSTIRANIYDTADNYFKENSFGKWGLVGANSEDGSTDVFGPYTIAYDSTACEDSIIRSQAIQAAQAAGVNLSNYNNLVFFIPPSSCGYSGVATVGGNPAYVVLNGNSAVGVITHELGHNMGAMHAGSWTCTESGVRVSVSADANCVRSEYGDPYDVMGNAGGMRHMNNYAKGITTGSMNWIPAQNIQTIDRYAAPDATYTLAPIEQSSTGIQSIRIPRTVTSRGVTDYYYLEFRQPFGFDQSIGTYVTNGVSIRVVPNANAQTTKLIDATPETNGFTDAPVAVGKTFTDPLNAINVSTLSVSPAGAQVRVSFGALPCIPASPSVSITPTSGTGFPGQTVAYTVQVTNSDTKSCAGSAFSVAPVMPNGLFQSPSVFTTGLIAPGASVSQVVNVTVATGTAPGTLSFTQKATNVSDASLSGSASASYVVKLLDLSTPVVSITKPENGSVIPARGNLQIVATASDNNTVTKIEVYMDSALIKTCSNTTSCAIKYSTNKTLAGNHTIIAKAYDVSGNMGTTEIQVTK